MADFESGVRAGDDTTLSVGGQAGRPHQRFMVEVTAVEERDGVTIQRRLRCDHCVFQGRVKRHDIAGGVNADYLILDHIDGGRVVDGGDFSLTSKKLDWRGGTEDGTAACDVVHLDIP